MITLVASIFTADTNHDWEAYYFTFRSSKDLATGHSLVFSHGDRLSTLTSPLSVMLPDAAALVFGLMQSLHSPVTVILANPVLPTLRWLAQTDTDDGITKEVGDVVRANTQPTDRIFVWGYVPEMHVYAQRLPSTRFFYTHWTTGLIP